MGNQNRVVVRGGGLLAILRELGLGETRIQINQGDPLMMFLMFSVLDVRDDRDILPVIMQPHLYTGREKHQGAWPSSPNPDPQDSLASGIHYHQLHLLLQQEIL